MHKLLLSLGLLASVAISGCTPDALLSAGGIKMPVTGKIFAPAEQTAAIAAGGYNYRTIQARSDEKGVSQAKVTLTDSLNRTVTAQTDTTGEFAAETSAVGTHVVTATFQLKDGKTVTLSGLLNVSGPARLELDVAHNLLASKLLESGKKSLEDTQNIPFFEARLSLESDLASVAKVPMPTNRSEAAAAFDANASADTKAKVDALLK